MPGRQREIDLIAGSITVVIVDHVEQPDAAAIGRLVMHEVHRQSAVDLPGYCQGHACGSAQALESDLGLA